MINIKNYKIISEIYNSINSLVYRAIRELDEQPVIIKMLREDYPTPEELLRYQQEYEITKNLNIEGVIKVNGLEKYHNTLIMFVEDFGGESLTKWLEKKMFTITEVLELAIKIIEIIGEIHENNVIHKDINPSNIVYNPETQQIKIIDFGISTILSSEKTTWKTPNFLEGTLAYISPEQTGRMNRDIDYRTDFYAFGVTLYELLTKKLPFKTEDVLDLIHSHLAKQPLLPHKINPKIPAIVSQIILKLLAKTPEERYQSAWGIKTDLELALIEYQTGKINLLKLGSKDQISKFKICQKLYGREAQIKTLLTAFEKVTLGEIQMMLVGGYSGIGKSVLVQEIYRTITEQKGYFVRGKFDQYQRNIPYSAIITALKELVKQLFTENTIKLKEWKEKIEIALGANGQIIIDLIPELELIIGKQEPVIELSGNEARNRFNLVWPNFINVFCQKEHPLVIFLDDLQWVDMASLKLIELMMTGNNDQYLFVIGAYRDNEVDKTHPLTQTLTKIEKNKANISYIYLSPLKLNQVNELIADSLNLSYEKTESLAELVLEKTDGNPFFLKEFLQSLYEQKLLYFMFNQGWSWDINKIKERNFTDNVVDFMLKKLQNLPEKTQNVLRAAACIGNQFDTKILMLIGNNSQAEIAKDLLWAVNLGLIIPTSNDYRFLIQDLIEINADIKAEYKFVHDRIQQAAYYLIPESERTITHLEIGKLLLANLSPAEKEKKYFDIINHLNQGIELLNTESERYKLAELNLIAGQKAKDSTAYQSGLNYLQIGLNLLPENAWIEAYELTLKIFQTGAELAYLCTDYAQLEKYSQIIINQGKSILDKVKIYEYKIQAYNAQNQQLKAIKLGLEILELLGIHIPLSPATEYIENKLKLTQEYVHNKTIEYLYNLPLMTDEYKLSAINIIVKISTSIYQSKPELFPLVIAEAAYLSFQYGNTLMSPFIYTTYGMSIYVVLADIESSYKFGKLAVELIDKLQAKYSKCRTLSAAGTHIFYLKDHIKSILPMLLEAYESGLNNGDLEFAGYCLISQCHYAYWSGKDLKTLVQETEKNCLILTKLKQFNSLTWTQIMCQSILNLLGESENPIVITGKFCDEDIILAENVPNNHITALQFLYINKMILCYLFEEHILALDNANILKNYINPVLDSILLPIFYFYDSLIKLSGYENVNESAQYQFIYQVISNQEYLRKLANYAPENYQNKFYLVAAEKARITGENMIAMELYDRAIALSKKSGFIQEQALSYELAAKFYLSQGKKLIARAYMQEARYCYIHWGAIAKVQNLETKYPDLMPKKSTLRLTDSHQITSNTSYSSEVLDLRTLIKSLQTISSEILLEKLLNKLINNIMENAGSDLGLLLVKEQNKWVIKSQVKEGNLQSITEIPETIINYANRTHETVMILDSSSTNQFSNDIYLKKYQPKSILCMPMLYQGQLISIIYLENHLTTNAFTEERLEIIKILCYQGAIALENARLYELQEEYAHTLEEKVAERTVELEQANQQLYRLANLDGLTQVANRRRFDEYLQQEWRVMFREKKPLSLILSDVDYFKKYNDHYGHQGGDECLQLVAKVLSNSVVRAADLVARYGGEEFVIILPNTDRDGAINVAEKIRIEMQKLQIINAESDVNPYVTLSLGIACLIPSLDTSPEILINRADQALYEAKKQGRDRYIIYQ